MRSPGTRRAGWAVILAASFVVTSLAAAPAWADKLILFKNGKALRVKSIKVENGWMMAEMGKGGTVGFRSADVFRVDEATGEGGGEATPNVASTEGRGVTRDSGAPVRADDSEAEVSSAVQDRIEQRQQELQEKQAQEAAGQNPPGVVPGLRPLQPFNPAAAAGRRVRRSRNNPPTAVGSRAATGIREIQPREGVELPEEESGDDE